MYSTATSGRSDQLASHPEREDPAGTLCAELPFNNNVLGPGSAFRVEAISTISTLIKTTDVLSALICPFKKHAAAAAAAQSGNGTLSQIKAAASDWR